MRSNPDPSAPLAAACCASSSEPRLANTSIRVPSAVRQMVLAAARALARPCSRASTRAWNAARCSASRIDGNPPPIGVEQQESALGDVADRRADRGNRRKSARCGKDRDVRSGPAAFQAKPDNGVEIEPDKFGRQQVARQQDRSCGKALHFRRCARPAGAVPAVPDRSGRRRVRQAAHCRSLQAARPAGGSRDAKRSPRCGRRRSGSLGIGSKAGIVEKGEMRIQDRAFRGRDVRRA